ncbi:sialic acid-binding Ig-like lectin 8 [Sarcophilus harrisii]
MDLVFLLHLFLSFLDKSFSQQSPYFDICVQESVTVQEGLCVSIPCSFNDSTQHTDDNQTYVYWFQKVGKEKLVATNDPRKDVQSSSGGQFQLIGDLQRNNCSLSITGVTKKDHGNYLFEVKKGELSSSKMLSVHVEDLTQKPEILIPDILDSGCQVTLTCIAPGNCKEGTSPNFLWTGSALSSHGFVSQNLQSPKLLFTPKLQDNGTDLTCQVTFPVAKVTTKTTVQLRIAYSLRILNHSCLWTEGRLFCTCSILGKQTSSLLWWVGESMVDGNSTDDMLQVAYNTSESQINSSLTLKPDPGLSIRCEGRDLHGTQSVSVLLLIPGNASSSPWNYLNWLIKGALCGSIISALFFTCVAVCLVKMFRGKQSKKDLKTPRSTANTKTESNDITLVEYENSEKYSPSEKFPSPVLDSSSQKENLVQYASLTFKTQKTQDMVNPEATHTEYSELKFH